MAEAKQDNGEEEEELEGGEEKPKKVSCFNCRRKKTETEERVNLAESEATAAKKGCWDRLKCCRKQGLNKKEKWAKRMDSILSEPKPKP